jgi:endonuclease YncB( thermonuclease family)
MQDLIKGAKIQRYLAYIVIAILAYFAGDQKILNTVLDEIGLNFNNHSISNNQISQSSGQGEDKIYFVGKYKVTHVVDGDTFDFLNEEGKKDTVRIMAVNTLEMKETDPTKLCFAKKQAQFSKDYLTEKEVYLYADKTQGLRDKYQRILAYVATNSQELSDNYLGNYFYNDYLVDTGNADIYRANPPAVLYERFESKRKQAQDKKLGMWGSACQNL